MMHKKLIYMVVAAAVGFFSIFMPWFTIMGEGISGVSQRAGGDGFIVGILFIVIIVLLIYTSYQNKLSKKVMLAVTIIAAIILVTSFADYISNNKMLKYSGGSVGIGLILSIITSSFVTGYSIYAKKDILGISNTESEDGIDKVDVSDNVDTEAKSDVVQKSLETGSEFAKKRRRNWQ